jgi:hypothetical protein
MNAGSARILIGVLSVAAAACGGSSPSDNGSGGSPISPTPPTGGTAQLTGRTTNAGSGTGAGSITISGDGVATTTSEDSGAFTVVATRDMQLPRSLTFAGTGFVTRQAFLRVPGSEATVSLIPTSLALQAFDEMCRRNMLLRWTTTPQLRVHTRTFQFASLEETTLTAIDDQMSDDEYNGLVQDLTWALPQLTGQQFTAFASITKQSLPPNASTSLRNDREITVARVAGLTSATGYWGYSRWRFMNDGTVIAGLTMLDANFERSGSPFQRALRSHELGHALGYDHVTSGASVMNANARLEPTAFDTLATRVAFQRLPGNRSPDNDPAETYSVNRTSARWSAPIP